MSVIRYFRFSIRFWLLLLFVVTGAIWGSYVVWDYQIEIAADRYIKLMDWKTNEEYTQLEKVTHSLPPEVEKRIARKLKKKYPMVSLADRLAYEKKWKREQLVKSDIELQTIAGRAKALKLLHEGKVKDFVTQPNFGWMRTVPRPLIFYLVDKTVTIPSPKLNSIDRSNYSNSFGEEIALKKKSPEKSPYSNDSFPIKSNDLPGDTPYIPSPAASNPLGILKSGHNEVISRFATMPGDVYVKSIDQVAGFSSHEISYVPWRTDEEKNANPSDKTILLRDIGAYRTESEFGKDLKVTRVDLVSLLMHDEPLVYVSEKLPNMEELSPESMRELDGFEKSALKRLQAGEDFVARKKDKTILMLGAIRAGRSCLECHSVQERDLLGAFSYVLTETKFQPKIDQKKQSSNRTE